MGRTFESTLKASAKRAEDERRKAATKERAELEKALAAQVAQVCVCTPTVHGAAACSPNQFID